MPEILIASLSPVGHIGTAVERRSGSGRPRRPCHGPELRRPRRQDPRRRRHPAGDSAGGRLRHDPPRHRPARARRHLWHQARQLRHRPTVRAADAAPDQRAVPVDGPDAVRRDHRRRGLLRDPAVPARRPRGPAAGAGLHHDPVDDQQPRHRTERHGPAAVVERARAAAQPRVEPAVAEGLAAPIAERRQLPAGSA